MAKPKPKSDKQKRAEALEVVQLVRGYVVDCIALGVVRAQQELASGMGAGTLADDISRELEQSEQLLVDKLMEKFNEQ